eukprot:scaffold188674_cov45-Attheya_sp.AAC.1
MAVVIVGYRTYPDADVTGQVDDLEQAMAMLYHTSPHLFPNQSKIGCHDDGRRKDRHWMGNCLMGHSSGAHIALLLLVERVRYRIRIQNDTNTNHHPQRWKSVIPFEFDSFVGLSGPYGISHHFDYEAGRGVEEISPMKPACGSSRQNFHAHSPAIQLVQLQSNCCDSNSNSTVGSSFEHLLPRHMLLVHGVEDTTVPFTATAEAGYLIRSCGVRQCEELYLSKTGHQDTVLQFMVGGKTKDAVHSWLQRRVSSFSNPRDEWSKPQTNGSADNNNSPRTFLMDSKL